MPYTIKAACMCSTGKVRKNNEDNFFFYGSGLDEQNRALNAPMTMNGSTAENVFVSVFDGMGGENFGECASYAATKRMQAETAGLPAGFVPDGKYIEKLCQDINLAVVEKQRELCTERMGSTLVSLCFTGETVYVSNLGDSRAYRYRDGALKQLSVDHVEKRPGHRKAPLTQHLGINPEELLIEPAIYRGDIKLEDIYLICSDGVTDMLADEEIENILKTFSDPEECVTRLVDAALEKGGIDNTTAIICRAVAVEKKKVPVISCDDQEKNGSGKRKKTILLAAAIVIVLAASVLLINSRVIAPAKLYNEAMDLMCSFDYIAAAEAFDSLGEYKDSADKAEACRLAETEVRYNAALEKMAVGEYADSAAAFYSLGEFKDSSEKAKLCEEAIMNEKYNAAISLMNEGKHKEAISAFEALDGYGDSTEQIDACYRELDIIEKENEYEAAIELMNEGKYEEAIAAFEALDGYNDSTELIEACRDALEQKEKEEAFEAAINLENLGKYQEAIEAFEALDGYKDSKERISRLEAILKESSAEIFETITFGTYEQDNNTDNGSEAIEWLVLDKKDGKLLVISKYALDCQPFNSERTSVSWEDCSLRRWLNDTFLNVAFSPEEQDRIEPGTFKADKNSHKTTDKVFLLSRKDAESIFEGVSARKCVPTDYAFAQNAHTQNDESNEPTPWWLCSRGYTGFSAVIVGVDGKVHLEGNYVDEAYVCVRPVMWIRLDGEDDPAEMDEELVESSDEIEECLGDDQLVDEDNAITT